MLITFLNLFLIARCYCIKNAFLCALTFLTLLVFLGTEGLSLFSALTSQNVWIFWGIIVGVTTFWNFWVHRKKKIELHYQFKKSDILKCLFIVWMICLFVLALLTIPNNMDSMSYHLSRIEYWIQNACVSHYPTNMPQQIYSPILAEYFILQTFLMFKTDLFANLVQFFSYLFSGVLLFQIAQKLNFSKPLQYVVTLLFLSIPMAIAQSVTTQNDLVATLWLLAFISLLLDLVSLKKISFNKETISLILLMSFVISFGFLTKSHICLSFFVLLFFSGIKLLKHKENYKYFFIYTILAFVVIFLLIAPTFYRNYMSTGDIFASSYFWKVAVGTLDPSYLLVNFLKNLSLLLANPAMARFPATWVNDFALWLDVPINHPDISLTQSFLTEIEIIVNSFHHDFVTPSYLTFLFVISLCLYILFLVFSPRKTPYKLFILFLFFAILSGLILLRYNESGSRLLLPYVSLMIIFIGCILNALQKIKNKKCYVLMWYLGLFALYPAYMTFDYQTKCIDRGNKYEKYFVTQPLHYNPYFKISEMIKLMGVENIGIWSQGITYDYPLIKMLKYHTVYHLMMEKQSEESLVPDVIVAIAQNIQDTKDLVYKNKNFKLVYRLDDKNDFLVYLRTDINLAYVIPFIPEYSTDLLSTNSFYLASTNSLVSKTYSPSLVFKTEYIKNAFDMKNGMEFHIAMEPLKQNPVEVNIYKNDTFLQKAFIDRLGWLVLKKIPLNQKENEFILRFEIKNKNEKKIQGIAIRNVLVLQKKQKKDKK